jgi:lactoylglutathione lyase
MRIEHVAVWTTDLERLRNFYVQFFGATAGEKYVNPHKAFASYFLTFESGARLEILHRPELGEPVADGSRTGVSHFAFSVGSVEQVDERTEQLRRAGVPVIDGPRRTGDGYYESVVLDPDGNRIELTV